MASTTFSGPVRTGQPAAAAANETIGTLVAAKLVPLPVTAVANTDFVVRVPKSKVLHLAVFTDTAYGAATDAQILIGSTVGGGQYVAATSIKAQGKVVLTPVAAGAIGTMATFAEGAPLYVRVTQSGAASAVGSATLAVEYVQQA